MAARFGKIYDRVTIMLRDQLAPHLKYHSLEHTLYVLERSEYIAEKEKINSKDLELLKIAALFHDNGFIDVYQNHEERGCDIARNELSNFKISKTDIDTICGMIMATKIPQKPNTILERIIADADLEYLSTNKFFEIAQLLYEEINYYQSPMTPQEWNVIQVQFIEAHTYHTTYCKLYKASRKIKNLNALKEKLKP